jgi:Xaa-Pro aminopeptidase
MLSPLNRERAFRMMEKYEIDALVATTPENNLYVSDFWCLSQWALKSAPVFTILPRDAEPAIVSPISDLDLYADNPSWIKDLRCYGTFYIEPQSSKTKSLMESEERLTKLIKETETEKTAVDALIKILKDRGLDSKTIEIDEGGVTCTMWNELQNKLPAAQIKHGASTFKEIRMVKTAEEIERLKKAAEISEKSLHAALENVKEGVSEADLAREFEVSVVKDGGKPFFTVFGLGSRSAFPNAVPSLYKLKKGDIVRFDGGCVYKNYSSDIALSAVFGQPTEKHKKYYNAIVRGTLEAINSVRPGVKASDLFNIALETTRKTGIPHYRRHHCGHGIGIEAYDLPIVRPTDTTSLEEGMVLNIETPYYEIGFGGLQIEETILVTDKGYKYLTTPIEELLIL